MSVIFLAIAAIASPETIGIGTVALAAIALAGALIGLLREQMRLNVDANKTNQELARAVDRLTSAQEHLLPLVQAMLFRREA